MLRNELVDLIVYCTELLFRRHAGARIHCICFDLVHVVKTANAHHEKFVQITAENRREFQPLYKRYAVVCCLGEHAVVESKPG